MTQWGIDGLFNPGKRHAEEEKRRLQSTREEVGDSSGGKRIDLDSGVVRISRRKSAAAPEAAPDAPEPGRSKSPTPDSPAAPVRPADQD